MPNPNLDRINFGLHALQPFAQKLYQCSLEHLASEDQADLCADLISDVLHFANDHNLNTADILKRGKANFLNEIH